MGVKGEAGASQDSGDVKAEASKHQITIKMGSGDEDIQLKAKGTTRFEKIYAAVGTARGIDPASFKLTYDGERINPEDTRLRGGSPILSSFAPSPPAPQLTIDFHMAQIGGGLSSRS
ncbi:hypothetical protein JCM6882_008857 [Rhodosporidiobolus microsporus]